MQMEQLHGVNKNNNNKKKKPSLVHFDPKCYSDKS